MTQVTQVTQRKNSGLVIMANPRARNWFFTLNNPTDESEDMIKSCGGEYLYQLEKGKSGTPHLQGVIIFKNALSLKSVRKKIKGAHLMICNNLKKSAQYCSKEDTKIGEVITNSEKLVRLTQMTQQNSEKKCSCQKKVATFPCEKCREEMVKEMTERLVEKLMKDDKTFNPAEHML